MKAVTTKTPLLWERPTKHEIETVRRGGMDMTILSLGSTPRGRVDVTEIGDCDPRRLLLLDHHAANFAPLGRVLEILRRPGSSTNCR